jgi:uncharacterized membrane protein YuzA (DUF378 family)
MALLFLAVAEVTYIILGICGMLPVTQLHIVKAHAVTGEWRAIV